MWTFTKMEQQILEMGGINPIHIGIKTQYLIRTFSVIHFEICFGSQAFNEEPHVD